MDKRALKDKTNHRSDRSIVFTCAITNNPNNEKK